MTEEQEQEQIWKKLSEPYGRKIHYVDVGSMTMKQAKAHLRLILTEDDVSVLKGINIVR